MGWKFWQRQKYGELSVQLRRGLKADFSLSWEEINRLGCIKEAGQHGGKPVTHIYVFDPDLIGDEEKSIKCFEDLAPHTDVILFEVRMEEGGSISVMDKRAA
ncbi:MAG: hypothetical protein V3U79_03660 [Dehalococcoidia bacterium]